MHRIVNKLNEIGSQLIDKSFQFKVSNGSLYAVANSELQSKARNIRRNNTFECNVVRFFDDFWLYIRIDFKEYQPQFEASWDKKTKDAYLNSLSSNLYQIRKTYYNIYSTLSVFQGQMHDKMKTQLFRAEWDNYPEQENDHPQPHWHIYPHKYSSNIHQSFEDYLDLGKTDNDFKIYIGDKKINDSEIIKIEKFHFAMNGQWSMNNSDAHKISTESELTNWFAGILNHIKKELEYLKVK